MVMTGGRAEENQRPSLLDYLKRGNGAPTANSSFKSMNDPSFSTSRNRKYNH
jgi:hypothetical protein